MKCLQSLTLVLFAVTAIVVPSAAEEDCVAPATCDRKVIFDADPPTTSVTCSKQQCTAITVDDSWFCTANDGTPLIDYTARVESGTGLPPGKKEDDFARCVYSKLQSALQLYNCRDFQYWTCDDCKYAYKYWLCATSFPQCASDDPEGPVVKPCRGLCNDVVRKCPPAFEFVCPLGDVDYLDYVDHECASLGLPVSLLEMGIEEDR